MQCGTRALDPLDRPTTGGADLVGRWRGAPNASEPFSSLSVMLGRWSSRAGVLVRFPASITSSMETRTWRWGLLILSPVMIAIAVFSFLQYLVHDPRPEALGTVAVLGMVIGIAAIVAALSTRIFNRLDKNETSHTGP